MQLTKDFQSVANPRCSNDGNSVFFQGYFKNWTIWKIPIEGGAAEEIVREAAGTADISPDGQTLVFDVYDEKAKSWRTKVRSLMGTEAEKVFDLDPIILRWSPDGRRLAYLDSKRDGSEIMIQPLHGGPAKALLRLDGNDIWSFEWSRDGSQFAVVRGKITFDAVLLTRSQ